MASRANPEDIMMEEEPEEDPEEEIYEESDEGQEEVVYEEYEEEIDVENEEDQEEEIVEEIEEDPEEEITEESGEKGLNSRGMVGNKDYENLEEKRGSKATEESSRKCRKSRWDHQREGETREIDGSNKRRKTRWDNNNSQNGLTNPSGLIDSLELLKDPKTIKLRDKLMRINKKLQSSVVYNADVRDKLIIEKISILSSLTQDSPSFQSPTKLVAKVLIPEKEYPSYNFIGLILGPKGNTQKKMEKETGAKILLRGKGSGDAKSENEDLHVRVEADNIQSLNAAEMMIKKLLIPVADLNNDHKRAQLMELAKLRGAYTDNIICDLCKEKGHKKYACPLQESTFKAVCCDVCGSIGHLASMCNVSKDRSNKEVDSGKLYVGYLPNAIDDKRLKELFVPYGKITNTTVIKDQRTGVSKGYGFVKFENSLDAEAAIKYMNGYKMGGKMLAVRVAGQRPTVGPVHPGHLPPVPSIVGLNNESLSFALFSGHNSIGLARSQTNLGLTSYLSSSSQGFSAGIPTSLPDSVSYQFPGDPDYQGSVSYQFPGDPDYRCSASYQFSGDPDYRGSASYQFPGDPDYRGSSFFGGIEMNATQDCMPEIAKNTPYFPSL